MATTRETIKTARKLRRTMSPPEIMLWQILRQKPLNIKFRRQHPVGPYVLDFYFAAAKLAIELDGISHNMGDRPQRDGRRNCFLSKQGIETLRIPAQDVLTNLEEVADQVVRHVQANL